MNSIGLYRLSHFFYKNKHTRLSWLVDKILYFIFNSHIPGSAQIGENSKCAYGGIGVVIHSRAKIGARVIIGQGITIGRKLEPSGVPVIGDDVYISAGARILGDITIGNNVIIGANSVVITDIADNSIAAGIPAKVVRTIDCSIYSLLKNIY